MEKLAAHPSREELSAYSLGQLPEERAVAIDSHISECEPCCETMLELSSEDTFAGLLQEAGRLSTDLTADRDSLTSRSTTNPSETPLPLIEHPRYEILGLIGKGGMGDVYKARHRKMERTVALKVINRGLVRKAEAIDRFHREVKAAAQLSHPNIVTSHDADHAGDFHFMVMEFVDGVDLSQTVKNRGALPIAEACDYIRQAAIGLQHAHERGMVHRDIKPHNLMVTANGIIKILDFGLASLAPEAISPFGSVEERPDLTAAGMIMGTPDFISPEQANDASQVDIRSDIYSLGATLYYLLSGRVPFDEGSVLHKLRSHAQVEPAKLNSLRDDVPERLVALVSKMMAKDPDERYLTPKEVAAALESFMRTWQPGGASSQQNLISDSGPLFNSVGQGSGRDWLLVVAKILFVIALIPVALLAYETWAWDRANPDVGAGYHTWAYLLVTLCLSAIAGIASAVHRLNSGQSLSSRGDHRGYQVTASEILTVTAILMVGCLAAGLYYASGNLGGIRVAVTAPEDIGSLGTHPLTIVDTSGMKPVGGTTSTHQDDDSGITTHSFTSANGRYNITLVGNILTVNGEKYTVENPSDRIRIVDDRVEITRDETNSKNGVSSRPNVNVASYSDRDGYQWELAAQKVEAVRIRLLHIANGKIEVASESVLQGSEQEASFLNLNLTQHTANEIPKSETTTIDIAADGMSFMRSRSAPLKLAGTFRATHICTDGDLAWHEPTMLFLLADYSGDLTYRRTASSLMEASKGNARFVALEIEWVAKGDNKVPDWLAQNPSAATPAESESDQLAIQGEWRAILAEDRGRAGPPGADRNIRMAIAKESITMEIGGRKVVSNYELDPSTTPKSIDMIAEGQTKRGIYELVGDTLKICLSEATDERPAVFDTQADSPGVVVLTLKRVKLD